jgi:hypothetical protein
MPFEVWRNLRRKEEASSQCMTARIAHRRSKLRSTARNQRPSASAQLGRFTKGVCVSAATLAFTALVDRKTSSKPESERWRISS